VGYRGWELLLKGLGITETVGLSSHPAAFLANKFPIPDKLLVILEVGSDIPDVVRNAKMRPVPRVRCLQFHRKRKPFCHASHLLPSAKPDLARITHFEKISHE
jgi:hypothetical protein